MNLHEVLFASKMTGNSGNSEVDFSEYVKKTQIDEMLSTLAGETVTGKVYNVDGTQVTAKNGAEVFNDYKNNKAIGAYSHAEGNSTTASGYYSHSEGYSTRATGNYSHTEGYGTTASAPYSHAEGSSNTASGYYSHAEGYNTKATGQNSHAEGTGTIAKGTNSHVMGKYNVEDTENKFAFIIGNGTSDTQRSNAFAIDWQGNIYVNNSSSPVNVLDLMNRLSSLEAKEEN
ncbi:MAG: hypothetical protein NC205_00440 [Prevotella sp.]|nr:hypothetical protein [Alistipes senegalensis]MCM1357030.1 hypothetical protein [Prevotella sp.]MCM1473226.1 hypothetical protein [Muribaculaceae bacterium]